MKRVVHFHTDPKFLSGTSRFEGGSFANTDVFIRMAGTDSPVGDSHVVMNVEHDNQTTKKMVELASEYDLVVMHCLDSVKARIVNRLPKHIPVGWRFFGAELYSRNSQLYLSNLSQQHLRSTKDQINRIRRALSRGVVKGIRRLKYQREFQNAVSRVDLFFGVFPHEYEHLRSIWGELPNYIQFPLRKTESIKQRHIDKSENLVLIGNRRSPFSNHLDILEMINEVEASSRYHFVLPFSYGDDGRYASEVRHRASLTKGVRVIEDFIPYTEYIEQVASAKAAVFNNYRQLGLWNIFVCLVNDVKVYLNTRNPTYQWLVDEGFAVYSVDQFKNDLATGNLAMAKGLLGRNEQAYGQLARTNDALRFQNILMESISH